MSRIDESQFQDVESYRAPDIQDTLKNLHGIYGGELEEGQKFLRVVQLEFKLDGRKFLLKPDLVPGVEDLGLAMACDLYVTLHFYVEYQSFWDRVKTLFRPGQGVRFKSQSGDAFLMTGLHAKALINDAVFMNILKTLLIRRAMLKTKGNALNLLSPVYQEGDVEKLGQLAERLEVLVKKG